MLTMISEICGNKIIQTGAVAWVISQILKTILHLIVNKKIVWERLFGDGGMPSSHSATVTSVAAATGFTAGWGSPVFGVAVFMAIIVMHDARGVRRETGKQAVVINDMIELFEKMGAGNLTPEHRGPYANAGVRRGNTGSCHRAYHAYVIEKELRYTL